MDCEFTGPMQPGFEDRAIEASQELRAVPDDVFCYPRPDLWRPRVWNMLGDIVTEEVRAAFVRAPPEYIVSDDLGWLDAIIERATGVHVDMKCLVADRLEREYRAFRAVHGTRTNDLGQFYRGGLRLLRPDDIEAVARRLFASGAFDHVTEDRFAAAVADLGARNEQGGRGGRLYFCADERSLITTWGRSGHYLVYGSEYLFNLGIRLVSRSDTKGVLKSIGRPTMFVCDIPMARPGPYTLRYFGGMMIEYLFCELINDPDCHVGPYRPGGTVHLRPHRDPARRFVRLSGRSGGAEHAFPTPVS